MNNDFKAVLEKFMDTMGVTYKIELARKYRDSMSRKGVCIRTIVLYMGQVQYHVERCFILINDKILFDGGNEIIEVKDGILAYLGDNIMVGAYFAGLARDKATKELISEEH